MIKKSDKLPRGSYFYLQVGHRFFSGWEHAHEEIEKTIVVDSPSAIHSRWWSPMTRRNWRYNPRQRAKHGLKVPAYQKNKIINTTTRKSTGQVDIVLVDDPKSAKQYRTKSQIQAVQQELERAYKDIDVKISIRLHEGESK